jgi:PAS domain S-box-containing protein
LSGVEAHDAAEQAMSEATRAIMTFDLDTRRGQAVMAWSAGLFAVGFWLLDTATLLRASNVGLFPALLPQDGDFFYRLVVALAFAVAGALTGAAMLRSSSREENARQRSRRSEQKYRALLASSFESILTLNREGRIVDLSDSAAHLFDGDALGMVGMSVDKLVEMDGDKPASPAATLSALLRVNAYELRKNVPASVLTLNGRKFPAEICITPMPDGGNSRFVVAVRETTDSVVAKKALKRSETQYRALFDNILDGVYRSRPDGTLLAANPAMVNMLGYDSREELLANDNTNHFFKDPEQRTKIVALLEDRGEARNVEIRLRRRDGSTLIALANIRSITDESGTEIVYEGTLSDISDLLQVRAALEESEEHFRALTENARDIITVIDENGCIVYSSPSIATISKRTAEELVGSDFYRCMRADDQDEVRRQIEQSFIRPGTPQEFTCQLYADDQSVRCFDAVATAYMTRTGTMRAVVHSRDVTKRLATEIQLQRMQSQQAVDELTRGIAREFNNLLTAILGNLDSLDESIDEGTGSMHINLAKQACLRASDLNRRLIALGEPQDAAAEVVNVNGVLLDLEPVLRRSLNDCVQVDLDLGKDLWPVRVSRSELEGTLLHLAVSAKDAMGENSRLAIRTCNRAASGMPDSEVNKPDGDSICINVRETRVGLDANTREVASDAAVPASPGAEEVGPGLLAVKTFAEAAGGKFHLIRRPGHGTTASIVLPRHNSPVALTTAH